MDELAETQIFSLYCEGNNTDNLDEVVEKFKIWLNANYGKWAIFTMDLMNNIIL